MPLARVPRRSSGRNERPLWFHFSGTTARGLDTLVEAWPMHQAGVRERLDRAYVAAVVAAIADRFEPAV